MFVFDPAAWLAKDRPYHGIGLPDPRLPLEKQPAAVLLALCCWGEARGEDFLGKLLVALVVRNRVNRAPRYGVGYPGVLLKPLQFSTFNPDDRNRPLLMRPLDYSTAAVWDDCCNAAYDILCDRAPDYSLGATLYHATHITPKWARAATVTTTVSHGGHVFYREDA